MGGNGADLGAVYQAIGSIAADLRALRSEMNARFGSIDTEFRSVRADIAELRAILDAYHGSVMGHGILLTEHDERLTRLEHAREAG